MLFLIKSCIFKRLFVYFKHSIACFFITSDFK